MLFGKKSGKKVLTYRINSVIIAKLSARETAPGKRTEKKFEKSFEKGLTNGKRFDIMARLSHESGKT